MELVLGGDESHVRFQILEVETRYELSAEFSIKVVDEGFCGSEDVWFEAKNWDAFVAQLQECERTRRGSAVLTHGAFGDLVRVESCNSVGAFVVRYNITRGRYLGEADTTATLSGVFGLEPSGFFGRLVKEFPSFADWVALTKKQDKLC